MKSLGERGSEKLKELLTDIYDWISFRWHVVLKLTPPRLHYNWELLLPVCEIYCFRVNEYFCCIFPISESLYNETSLRYTCHLHLPLLISLTA